MIRSYEGRCHCGAVRFRFTSEPITRGLRCNCSICRRRGAVMSAAYHDDVAIEGHEALRVYQWGDHDMHHYFCGTCGIHPFSGVVAKPGRYRINLGCVDEVDPFALPIDLIDGRAF
jgi:hypothetical protein